MAAPDPAVVERKMYVDMHLGGVDDPSLSLAQLKNMGGGGVNAFRAAISYDAETIPDEVPPHDHPEFDAEYAPIGHNHDSLYSPLGHTHPAPAIYAEYNNVSGALTVDGTIATHSVAMVGDTTVTISNPVNGMAISVWATGAYSLVVQGASIVTNEAVAVYVRGAWQVRSVSKTDMVAPTAGTLGVVVGYTTADCTVTGALDLVGLASEPYSFRYSTTSDGGTTWNTPGAWTAYQTSNIYQFTGLAQGAMFKFQHRVKDGVGNISLGAEVIKTTSAYPTWSDKATWTFTAADMTELNAFAPATGGGVVSLTAPATNLGASPPINNNIMSNKARVRVAGATMDHLYTCAAFWARGLGIEANVELAATGTLILKVGTNSAGSNQIGFNIDASGVATAYHFAGGSTVYTEVSGVPIPRTALLKAEFSKNPDGSCLGTLYVGGAVKGTVASTGWTWQGKHIYIVVGSNQVDSYYDNVRVFAASV